MLLLSSNRTGKVQSNTTRHGPETRDDASQEVQQWQYLDSALDASCYLRKAGIDILKRTNDRLNEGFRSRLGLGWAGVWKMGDQLEQTFAICCREILCIDRYQRIAVTYESRSKWLKTTLVLQEVFCHRCARRTVKHYGPPKSNNDTKQEKTICESTTANTQMLKDFDGSSYVYNGCYVMLPYVAFRHLMSCSAGLCNVRQDHAIPCHAIPCHSISFHAMQFNAI